MDAAHLVANFPTGLEQVVGHREILVHIRILTGLINIFAITRKNTNYSLFPPSSAEISESFYNFEKNQKIKKCPV